MLSMAFDDYLDENLRLMIGIDTNSRQLWRTYSAGCRKDRVTTPLSNCYALIISGVSKQVQHGVNALQHECKRLDSISRILTSIIS